VWQIDRNCMRMALGRSSFTDRRRPAAAAMKVLTTMVNHIYKRWRSNTVGFDR